MTGKTQHGSVSLMTDGTPDELPLDDATKLRMLASWFDHFDDWREATGKIAPGIAEYREVQDDLRRIAAALAKPAEGLDVERLARAILATRSVIRKFRVGDGPWQEYNPDPERKEAEAIAAEYERLGQEQP